jgi:hypothetical protein
MTHLRHIRLLGIALLACSLGALVAACGSESNENIREAYCDDGADNDADGRIDCEDPDCARAPACAAEHCYNLVDDDRDGQLDCDDPECDGSAVCIGLGEHCVSGRDDDRDGDADCSDDDCTRTAACLPGGENCTNGTDEDGDGDIDCADADCAKTAVCLPIAEDCTNARDDDEDGRTDCDDSDCARTRACIEAGEDCDNGEDDDGDGAIDCGDGDCAQTATCLPVAEGCANGLDDDGDGAVDCADDECSSSPDCRMPPEYCTNGIDDDGDGLVDCDDVDDCGPRAPCLDSLVPEVCDDGLDDNNDGATDCADPTCLDDPVCQEVCDDGVDDNDDGRIDCEDPSCDDFPGCEEAGLCDDGIDNDGDDFADCDDSECSGDPVCSAPSEVVVSVGINGGGTVRSLNGDITCPAECTVAVTPGTTVELLAIGDLGENLLSWENCDSTDASRCTITPQDDVAITANFGELARYSLPGISGCEGVDSGLLVLDEARLDDLDADELSSNSAGRSNQGLGVAHPDDGLDESVMQFNVFQTLPFEATHACIQLAEISLAMESRGSYSFYLGTGPFGGSEPPTTIISRDVVPTPQDAGMQLIELTTPYGPELSTPVWAGVAFPGDTNAAEIATAPTVAPGVANDAYLAYAVGADPTLDYLRQFEWEAYDALGDARYTQLQPVIRLLRAFDSADVTAFALEVQVGGSGVVTSANGLISCPLNCSQTYPPLQEVVLQASPGPGQSTSWTGCDQFAGDFCIVRMNDDRVVSAQFN